MTQNNEWQGKTGGGNFGQKLLFLYFKYGSITIAYAIVSIVVIFYIPVNYKATASIYNYFRTKHKYGKFKSIISLYQNHYLFGKSLIDKFAVFAGRKKAFKLEIEGQDIYDEILNNDKKGALVLNSHVGSSEIAGYLLKQNKKKFNALVFGGEEETMQKYRSNILKEQNINLIPIVDGFSHFFQIHLAAKRAELIGVAADRVYQGSKNIECNFMDSMAKFPLNPFQIAVKLNIPVIAFFVMIEGYKKYKIHVVNITEDYTGSESDNITPDALLEKYVEKLEDILKKYPKQWFNYYKFWMN